MRFRHALSLLLTAWGALTLSRPSHAAILSVVQPEVAEVIAVTAGDQTWIVVGTSAYRAADTVRVVPLPEGAEDVHLVPTRFPELGPKLFQVEQPPLCDPQWSCEVSRPPVEPPDRSPAKVPPAPRPSTTAPPASPPGLWDSIPSVPLPPRPPNVLRVVERSAIESTVKELTARIDSYYYRGPAGGADIAARAPSVSRFAVVLGSDTVAFRMRGPFVWPIATHAQGGPKEVVVTLLTPSRGTTLFPRALLRAEPPRLYLEPAAREGSRYLSATDLAEVLADQLAAEGKPVHLERAMPIDADERDDPNATLVTDFGLRELALRGNPRHFKLFRYRFRGIADIGFSSTAEAELPHPREIASAFVSVDAHLAEPGDPRCPRKFGACYRPLRQATGWRVKYGGTVTFPNPDPTKPPPRIVEAPYSLATPVMRDPSPFPPLPAPAPVSSAPSASSSQAPVPPAPNKAPIPGPIQPSPRGCACDTAAPPTTDAATALVGIAFALMGGARRRHSKGGLR